VRLRYPFVSIGVAVLTGLTLTYVILFPSPGNAAVRSVLLDWAVTLAAVALFVGVLNLLGVHWRKLRSSGETAVQSGVVVISLVLTFAAVLFLGPGHLWSRWIFDFILTAIESSLIGLLAVTLIYAAARLLRRRSGPFAWIFLATALLALAGSSPLAGREYGLLGEALSGLRSWLTEVPAVAGGRGLLIGIALGVIAAGLRIFLGVDRPYSG